MAVLTDAPEAEPAADAAVRPPPGNPRFPLLDSLRALAALAVLAAHSVFLGGLHARPGGFPAALLTNGVQGVTVFFVLSGFLLYRPFLAAEFGLAAPVPLRDYARRRLLRIVPAYWLALTLLTIYPGLTDVFTGHWWRYYLLLSGYSQSTYVHGLLVSWSLGVEVTFYLLLPLYALGVRRLTRGLPLRRRVAVELGVLATLAIASSILKGVAYPGHIGLQQSLPLLLLWFALGMAFALLSVAGQRDLRLAAALARVGRHPGWLWAAALGGYIALSAWIGHRAQYSTVQWVLGYNLLGGVISALLVAPAVFGAQGGGWPRRILAWRPLAWLGLISYGIYLWHVPLLVWLDDRGLTWFPAVALLGAALTVACAGLSYYLVERPILRFKYRGRRARPAARSG